MLYVLVWVTLAALIANLKFNALLSYGTTQHLKTFMAPSISRWKGLSDPAFYGVELAGFKS